MTTHSTIEAMTLLRETRAQQIREARIIARDLIRRGGTTHSRAVRAVMAEGDLLTPEQPEFWLGAVFHSPEFEWTGDWFCYTDSARNVHERTVKVWKLRAAHT